MRETSRIGVPRSAVAGFSPRAFSIRGRMSRFEGASVRTVLYMDTCGFRKPVRPPLGRQAFVPGRHVAVAALALRRVRKAATGRTLILTQPLGC